MMRLGVKIAGFFWEKKATESRSGRAKCQMARARLVAEASCIERSMPHL